MGRKTLFISTMVLVAALSCEPVDHLGPESPGTVAGAQDFAKLLSAIDLGSEQYAEVYDAVNSSIDNGYDEEYTLRNLFETPGAGVGDDVTKAPAKSYDRPLRELISEYLTATKAAGDASGKYPENFISDLISSEAQIYWPYSENWDGVTAPIYTFNPGGESETSIGYKVTVNEEGDREITEVTVTEELAMETPVWVINRNDDSSFTTLEMLRKSDPDWGAGGAITIGGNKGATKAGDDEPKLRTLILKQFTSHRNYDIWLAGASEFFVKTGSVEDFSASTEAELLLYDPSITDFVVVVRRGKVGLPIHFNAVLVSQWTDQLTSCAFMVHEDDGGTQTSWKCSAEVKLKSKTTGFNIEIPFRSRDDIVWRGQLSRAYLEKYSGTTGHFGDVDIKFEIVEL